MTGQELKSRVLDENEHLLCDYCSECDDYCPIKEFNEYVDTLKKKGKIFYD